MKKKKKSTSLSKFHSFKINKTFLFQARMMFIYHIISIYHRYGLSIELDVDIGI